MKIFRALLLLIFAWPGAVSAAATSEAVAIKKARLAQNAAIVRHDVARIAEFWTDDVTICRGLGAQLAGRAAYRQLFEDDASGAPDSILYERVPTSIEVGSAWPLAFETGTWKGYRGGRRGAVVIQGRYSAQWVKRGGVWLIRAEVFVALEGSGPGLAMHATP